MYNLRYVCTIVVFIQDLNENEIPNDGRLKRAESLKSLHVRWRKKKKSFLPWIILIINDEFLIKLKLCLRGKGEKEIFPNPPSLLLAHKSFCAPFWDFVVQWNNCKYLFNEFFAL